VDNLYEIDPDPDSIAIEDVTRHSIDLIAASRSSSPTRTTG
jgi:hypothetical protein